MEPSRNSFSSLLRKWRKGLFVRRRGVPVQIHADFSEPRLKIPACVIAGNIFNHLQPGVLVQIVSLKRVGTERQAQAIEAFPVLMDVLVYHTLCTSSHLHIQSKKHLVRPALENLKISVLKAAKNIPGCP